MGKRFLDFAIIFNAKNTAVSNLLKFLPNCNAIVVWPNIYSILLFTASVESAKARGKKVVRVCGG